MAGVDCRTGGWSAGWGGQGGVSHSISARTRQENARKESSAPQATLVLSNSKTANQAPGHV